MIRYDDVLILSWLPATLFTYIPSTTMSSIESDIDTDDESPEEGGTRLPKIFRIAYKEELTTGDAAFATHVSQQSIIKNIDRRALAGYRIPGSRFRKVLKPQLEEFAATYGIPLRGLYPTRAHIVGDEPRVDEKRDIYLRDARDMEDKMSDYAIERVIVAARLGENMDTIRATIESLCAENKYPMPEISIEESENLNKPR